MPLYRSENCSFYRNVQRIREVRDFIVDDIGCNISQIPDPHSTLPACMSDCLAATNSSFLFSFGSCMRLHASRLSLSCMNDCTDAEIVTYFNQNARSCNRTFECANRLRSISSAAAYDGDASAVWRCVDPSGLLVLSAFDPWTNSDDNDCIALGGQVDPPRELTCSEILPDDEYAFYDIWKFVNDDLCDAAGILESKCVGVASGTTSAPGEQCCACKDCSVDPATIDVSSGYHDSSCAPSGTLHHGFSCTPICDSNFFRVLRDTTCNNGELSLGACGCPSPDSGVSSVSGDCNFMRVGDVCIETCSTSDERATPSICMNNGTYVRGQCLPDSDFYPLVPVYDYALTVVLETASSEEFSSTIWILSAVREAIAATAGVSEALVLDLEASTVASSAAASRRRSLSSSSSSAHTFTFQIQYEQFGGSPAFNSSNFTSQMMISAAAQPDAVPELTLTFVVRDLLSTPSNASRVFFGPSDLYGLSTSTVAAVDELMRNEISGTYTLERFVFFMVIRPTGHSTSSNRTLAINLLRVQGVTETRVLYVPSGSPSDVAIVTIVLVSLGAFIAIAVTLYATHWTYKRMSQSETAQEALDYSIMKKDRTIRGIRNETDALKLAWRVDPSELRRISDIGSGSQGKVWKATFREQYTVCVKMIGSTNVRSPDIGSSAAKDSERTTNGRANGIPEEDGESKTTIGTDESGVSNPDGGDDKGAHKLRAAADRGTFFEADEVNFLMRTRHPRLVLFLGFGIERDGSIFALMEHMECGTMRAAMYGKPPLSWHTKIQWLLDACEGLLFLHNHKSLHRNIKASNILLSREGGGTIRAKLSDFGLATLVLSGKVRQRRKALRDKKSSHLAASDEWVKSLESNVGSPLWLAPEAMSRAHSKTKYGPAADIYSFGITLHETFVQGPPWGIVVSEKDRMRICESVRAGTRPSVPKGDESTTAAPPNDYVPLMRDCWHGDPTHRPNTEIVRRRLAAMLLVVNAGDDDIGIFDSPPPTAMSSSDVTTMTAIQVNEL